MSARTPVRSELTIEGRRLSRLDFGGPGRPLVALHGHLSDTDHFVQLQDPAGFEAAVRTFLAGL